MKNAKNLTVCTVTSHPTVEFAAQELKKYIRMMMPNAGDVVIRHDPCATDGYRLGLVGELGFSLPDVRDPALDDVMVIDTDACGGRIAGSNPRAVLLAVYEFLRQNGCRFLFPGVDGEYIPLSEVKGVRYSHTASCRYRGPCIEGACSQEILLETIDFLPKVGMNSFQMQFLVPTVFYKRYYEHTHNDFRASEPLSDGQMLQWKVACETEMAKRGISFHDVGHGWTVAPFGIDLSNGWAAIDDASVSDGGRRFIAELDGERRLYRNAALPTQFCMSSPEARTQVAGYVADYAAQHTNIDYIHVWLGDGVNNHCECEACREKSVTDWYVMLLNEIDRELTARGLATRVVFIGYYETAWSPETERIQNPDRFTLMLAPITRSYTQTLTGDARATEPFVRNKVTPPADLDGYLAYYRRWRRVFDGDCFCFEYHFWEHQAFDPSGLFLARRIFEDVEAYKANGIDGMIACGSQRAFFPTGFAYYVFARKQYDMRLGFDELLSDYFSAAFGEEWRKFVAYLERIGSCFGHKFLECEESKDASVSPYYNPERAERLRAVREITAEGRKLIAAEDGRKSRLCAVSLTILGEHADYCDLLADAFICKADGDDDGAARACNAFVDRMNARERYIERYYEHYLAVRRFAHVCGVKR